MNVCGPQINKQVHYTNYFSGVEEIIRWFGHNTTNWPVTTQCEITIDRNGTNYGKIGEKCLIAIYYSNGVFTTVISVETAVLFVLNLCIGLIGFNYYNLAWKLETCMQFCWFNGFYFSLFLLLLLFYRFHC